MRKLLIALVAALLVISLLAAPVMAQEAPTKIPVPDEASPGAEQANDNTPEEAPDLEPGELDVPPPDRI